MLDVDELISQHKKVMKGTPRKCKKCDKEMKKTGVRMSMSVNYEVFKCLKCGAEELEYVSEAD